LEPVKIEASNLYHPHLLKLSSPYQLAWFEGWQPPGLSV